MTAFITVPPQKTKPCIGKHRTTSDIVRVIIEEKAFSKEKARFEEVSRAMKEAGKRLYSWKTIAELYNNLY